MRLKQRGDLSLLVGHPPRRLHSYEIFTPLYVESDSLLVLCFRVAHESLLVRGGLYRGCPLGLCYLLDRGYLLDLCHVHHLAEVCLLQDAGVFQALHNPPVSPTEPFLKVSSCRS